MIDLFSRENKVKYVPVWSQSLPGAEDLQIPLLPVRAEDTKSSV